MNQTKVDVDIPIDKDFSKIINYKYREQNSLCGAKEANLILPGSLRSRFVYTDVYFRDLFTIRYCFWIRISVIYRIMHLFYLGMSGFY